MFTNTSRFWGIAIIFLVVAIIAGGVVILLRFSPGQPVEITLPQPQPWQGTIRIDGSVGKPGSYRFRDADSISSLIQAAGGTSSNLSALELHVGTTAPEQQVSGTPTTDAQKIDINRADAKTLESLPGIGEILAQRIIDYRQTKGSFRSTGDIIGVNGIGPAIYEKIKDLITTGE